MNDYALYAAYLALLIVPFLAVATGIGLLLTSYLKPSGRLLLVGIGLTLIGVGVWSGFFVGFGNTKNIEPSKASPTK